MPPEPKLVPPNPEKKNSAGFIPKPGQTDYTNIRRAPVINCIVKYKNKILLVQRNKEMRIYPGYWSGVSGFLDDGKGIESKVKEELSEELGIGEENILSIKEGKVYEQEEEKYQKTWIVHPILVEIKTDVLHFDWEAQDHVWIKPEEYKNFNIIPNFDRVLKSFFQIV